MKALPIIIAALAVVLFVRLGLRRRGRGRSSPLGVLTRGLRGKRLLGDTGLVAGREIRERLRGRLFRVVTLILFAVVAAAVVIPTIHTGTTTRQKVGVVAGPPTLDTELQKLATAVGLGVVLVREPDLSAARAALSATRCN